MPSGATACDGKKQVAAVIAPIRDGSARYAVRTGDQSPISLEMYLRGMRL
jgi:hypothetical protein